MWGLGLWVWGLGLKGTSGSLGVVWVGGGGGGIEDPHFTSFWSTILGVPTVFGSTPSSRVDACHEDVHALQRQN